MTVHLPKQTVQKWVDWTDGSVGGQVSAVVSSEFVLYVRHGICKVDVVLDCACTNGEFDRRTICRHHQRTMFKFNPAAVPCESTEQKTGPVLTRCIL